MSKRAGRQEAWAKMRAGRQEARAGSASDLPLFKPFIKYCVVCREDYHQVKPPARGRSVPRGDYRQRSRKVVVAVVEYSNARPATHPLDRQ
jgi:hypothetical protein